MSVFLYWWRREQSFIVFLLLIVIPHLHTEQLEERVKRGTADDDLESIPYFEENEAKIVNITVQKGRDIFLSCRVNNLVGDKMVSWMRRDESGNLKLLTYGTIGYSLGPRQSLTFFKPNDWRLNINQVQISDAGHFQCQISTHPPKILHFKLNVIAPRIQIVDDGEKPLRDKIYKTGSTLELKCIVDKMDDEIAQQHVHWYHGLRSLNNDTLRGGISVKSWLRRESGHSKTSKLYIANVNSTDSGQYLCSIGIFGNASVLVSVLNESEESPAANWQTGKASHLILPAIFILLPGLFIIGYYQL